jgi:hypothetical protein
LGILTRASEALRRESIKQAQESKTRYDRQIAKPEGQAGRGTGYTLHLAMGLENDHFLRLQVFFFSYMLIYAA